MAEELIVVRIMAQKEWICINLNRSLYESEKERIAVTASRPFMKKKRYEDIIIEEGNRLKVPRMDGEWDKNICQFYVEAEGNILSGPCYVEDYEAASLWNYEREPVKTKKALAAWGEDLDILGIGQSLININLPAMLREQPLGDEITYSCSGKTYFFEKQRVEELDARMQECETYGVAVTAILLNAPKLFDSNKEQALLDKVIHPDYDWNCSEAYISAFPVVTEEGQDYYRAFVEFLAERYTREDRKYGRMTGMIVSNEVDSQYIWGNAGEKTVEEYMHQYSAALRMAWLSSRKYYSRFQVYISLDHFWTGSLRPEYTKRFYGSRRVLDCLKEYGKAEGEFGWGVAHHPYPEDLHYPDFYNDRTASFSYSTMRITFKNIEMLPAYLSEKDFLYREEPRRIILSEQGFNSREEGYTKTQAAAAYCLAYQKVKRQETIDWMTHHAYVDNPYEFGLNLGIREYGKDGKPGTPKPIYYMMKDMDTEREQIRMEEAKAFIGAELYDSLIQPHILYGEEDKTKETQFQEE